MKRGTRLFLLAGCALVLALEVPVTLAALAEGWRGPYGARPLDARHALLPRPGVPPAALLARH